MSINLVKDRGVPLSRQFFTWKDLVREPSSKLDDDAFTRVRIILMNGIETEALRFSHVFSRTRRDLQLILAELRRVEQHQQTMVNWLVPPEMSPLEITIAYEQVAIEVTAALAQNEPDAYLAQVYRFGLLEDFDHLYRYSALLDRVEGKDPNVITQCYTDIRPGRPTAEEHRAPKDNLRDHYDRRTTQPVTKLNALTLVAGEFQTHDYYMNVGPQFNDPAARQLYAEIASIEEQHVTQYESVIDPTETWLEKWVLHEANEVYNYHSCVVSETNPRIKAIWERFLDYELGHLAVAREKFEELEKRDAAEILPEKIPDPIDYRSQRAFVEETLNREVDLRANGARFVPREMEGKESIEYRRQMNSEGSPAETVAAGYHWRPGTALAQHTLIEKLAV